MPTGRTKTTAMEDNNCTVENSKSISTSCNECAKLLQSTHTENAASEHEDAAEEILFHESRRHGNESSRFIVTTLILQNNESSSSKELNVESTTKDIDISVEINNISLETIYEEPIKGREMSPTKCERFIHFEDPWVQNIKRKFKLKARYEKKTKSDVRYVKEEIGRS